MGADEKADLRDLLRLLDNHVQSHYSSYKNAFLQLDAVSINESVQSYIFLASFLVVDIVKIGR